MFIVLSVALATAPSTLKHYTLPNLISTKGPSVELNFAVRAQLAHIVIACVTFLERKWSSVWGHWLDI